MLFVIIAFAAIVLIYSAIILVVWWPPKDSDSQQLENSMSLPANQKVIQTILRIITGLYALLLIPASLIALIAPFAMVGSGSQQGKLAAFLMMATFPFTIIASIMVAWILFRRRSVDIALAVTLLPLVQLAASYFVPGVWSAL